MRTSTATGLVPSTGKNVLSSSTRSIGMVGAVPGAWLNHQVPGPVVMGGFAATMLAAARAMTSRPARRTPRRAGDVSWGKAGATGLAVGLATGFFGVGGGFLIVPALALALGVGMVAASATSLLVIALNCAAGLVPHLAYAAVDWPLAGRVTAAALAGVAVAFPLAHRLNDRALRRGTEPDLACRAEWCLGRSSLWS